MTEVTGMTEFIYEPGTVREGHFGLLDVGDLVLNGSSAFRVAAIEPVVDAVRITSHDGHTYDVPADAEARYVSAADVSEREPAPEPDPEPVPALRPVPPERVGASASRGSSGGGGGSSTPARPRRDVTDRQVAFVRSLVSDVRELGGEVTRDADEIVRLARRKDDPRSTLSGWIDVLIARRDGLRDAAKPEAKKTAAWPEVAEGRYAVEVDGELKFYRVTIGDSGRWEGFTFLDAVSGGPGALQYHPIKNAAHKRRVLETILEAGEREAMERFGREVGVCGRCASPLTDPESRALGLGPVCAGKV